MTYYICNWNFNLVLCFIMSSSGNANCDTHTEHCLSLFHGNPSLSVSMLSVSITPMLKSS